ncbi:hypothetical protein [Shewanella youngdeokensis]|uniref:hypothetical protein n=1 Tax=Shewanella youngdeokensis TaxID=2999068 RepID=UPI004046F4CA
MDWQHLRVIALWVTDLEKPDRLLLAVFVANQPEWHQQAGGLHRLTQPAAISKCEQKWSAA